MEFCNKCDKIIEREERIVIDGYDNFFCSECANKILGIEIVSVCDHCGKEIKKKDKTISKGEEIYHIECANVLRVKISV